MYSKPILLLLFLLASVFCFAQEEDLLKQLDTDSAKKEWAAPAFKSTRVIMSHSVEVLPAGVLDFRILHRFGNINQGISQFFGLDESTIRLGLDYGISNKLTVGLGRGSYKKELDAFLKYKLVQQAVGLKASPVSVALVGGTTLFTTGFTDPNRENLFSSRMAYYAQVIAARRFSNRISIQVMPTLLHRNLVATNNDANDLFAAGLGGRVKLSNRISLTFDYYVVVNQNETLGVHNPLSVGVDIETGGHVFQLHFTNAVGMNERVFLTETGNDWGKGEIQFGFNISRTFQLKKKKI
ncbi:MAG: DUF5777 family beta-barrel protein [Bacteroidota bacterium]